MATKDDKAKAADTADAGAADNAAQDTLAARIAELEAELKKARQDTGTGNSSRRLSIAQQTGNLPVKQSKKGTFVVAIKA